MSDIDDLNNDPSKVATDFMYPDGGGGPVEVGPNATTTSRPKGYASSTEGTGVVNGVKSDDITGLSSEGSFDTRRVLGDWLEQQTRYNITPTPSGGDMGDGTIDDGSKHHKFVDPALISTVYSDDPDSRLGDNKLDTQQLPYGKDGSANTLLRDVEGTARTRGVYLDPENTSTTTSVGRVSDVLSRNRFNPGKGFSRPIRAPLENWSDTQKFSSVDDGKAVSTLGGYYKELDGLAMSDLQNVAEQLLLNAVGDNKTGFGDKSAASFNVGAGDPLPFGNSTQLGRNRENFNADLDFRPAAAIKAALTKTRTERENINGAMANQDLPVEDLPENKDHIRTSYGVLNNHLEPFAGAFPTAMIVLAAVGALASLIWALVIAAILDLLGVLVSLAGGNIPPGNGLVPTPTYQIGINDPNPSQLPFGQAFGNDDYGNTDFFSALSRWMNIPALEYDYPIKWLTCLTGTLFGTLEFFIGNAFSRVAMPQILTNSAGYYNVVIRNAMRDVEQITEASDNRGEAANPVEGFFMLIEAFTTSATFKFVTTMMQIGDRVLCGSFFETRDNDGRVLPKNLPENRPGPVLITDLHMSSRRKADAPRMSYSFTSLPQVYIRPREEFRREHLGGLPMTYLQDSAFKDFAGPESKGVKEGIGIVASNVLPTDVLFDESIWIGDQGQGQPFMNRLSYFENGRIPTDFREQLETLLDAYYVPFYFHDLRTNEIMPLPVFVDSISDSFSPSWNEQKGFGRGDPVQIYGGTTRKIGFSFYMVATNQNDYSALYYGINKLVSMVYPQWGGGTNITNQAGQSFRKPYSMVQTASPIVRIRLGELFASNRTPESVRRMFGAHLNGFVIGEDEEENQIVPNNDPPPSDVNPAALEQVRSRSRSLVPGSAYDLIQATIISSAATGFKADEMFNFAGCSADGTGGALNMEGQSFLLPLGTIFTAPKGRYKRAEPTGMGFKFPWLKQCRYDYAPAFEIINYGASGGKGKVAIEKKGGYLKNKLYYIVKPVNVQQEHIPGSGYSTIEYEGLLQKHGDKVKDTVGLAVPISNVTAIYPTDPPPPLIPAIPPPPPPPPIVDDAAFFKNNLLVEAMRESGGAGLAGAITNLDFDWNQAPWETDPDLGRAPTYVKVTLGFTPIHDEPLGLAEDGSLRAVAYPVGKLVEKVMGRRFGLPGYDPVERLSLIQRAQAVVAQAVEAAEPEGEGAGEGDLE